MTPETTNATVPALTADERAALRALHQRYQRDRDRFAPEELARLGFIRWLYQSRWQVRAPDSLSSNRQ